ncbi:MAG: nucleotidyl transferase AbiEii/AbiGii toxin family protein [Candidatus Omnitrophica bacterium]|nr:nucleotidyl transferase AbiEii/AbiGii toxin family protein [Candidatus Omnitrophota bacterium]
MLDNNEHRAAMYRLLVGIFRDPYLSAVLGFKGGTACYFFHDLPRFSVDLDFDIISKGDASVRDKIYERVERIVKEEGFILKDGYIKHNTVFLLASYDKEKHNIKIEISGRDFPNTYEAKNFYGLQANVLVKADMFAHKLVAAMERKKTALRDIFDIWFFFKNGWPINGEMVKLRTGKKLKSYLKDLKSFIQEKIGDRPVLGDLGSVLNDKTKAWVKAKLKKELIGLLDFYIDKQDGD